MCMSEKHECGVRKLWCGRDSNVQKSRWDVEPT